MCKRVLAIVMMVMIMTMMMMIIMMMMMMMTTMIIAVLNKYFDKSQCICNEFKTQFLYLSRRGELLTVERRMPRNAATLAIIMSVKN